MKIEYLLPDPLMNRTIASNDGVQGATYEKALQLGRRAEGKLAAHRAEGYAKIEVEAHPKGAGRFRRYDFYVSLVDPKTRKNPSAPYAIEFGHMNRNRTKYVEGLYIITSTYANA